MNAPGRIGELIAAQRKAEAARLKLAALAGAVVTVAAVCLLGLSGWFITGAAIAGLGGAAAVQAFNYLMPSALIRLLAILRTGARYIERVAGHEAALRALARLRPQLFKALAEAPPRKALALSSGEASARLIQDIDAVQTLFVRLSSPWALGAGAAAAALLTALASPVAAVALLLVMAASAGGAVLIGRRLADPPGRELQIANGLLKDRLAALEAVAPELKAYGLDKQAAAECAALAARSDEAQIALASAGGWLAAWQAAMTGVAVGAVVVMAQGASAPLVALAALAAVMGMEAAAGLVGALQQNGAASAAIARLEDAVSSPDALPGGPVENALTLSLVGKTLRPPQRLAIVGPSGVGKTSLIERLIGLRDALPDGARLGARDAAAIDPGARRAVFAYAAQDVRLMDGTIRQNLQLAGSLDEAALWEALEDAALFDRVRADPRGLDAPVGPNGERLSGGERRRLGLARAFLKNAPWLVLDEPTEGLDAAAEARVLEALARRLERTGQGLILVSHRPAPAKLCGTVLKMAATGRTRAAGVPA